MCISPRLEGIFRYLENRDVIKSYNDGVSLETSSYAVRVRKEHPLRPLITRPR